MSLPQELLDELCSILRSVAAYELQAHCSLRLPPEVLHSIAGNAVQAMCGPLECYAEAVLVVAERRRAEQDRAVLAEMEGA
jgi:hypothetical protein